MSKLATYLGRGTSFPSSPSDGDEFALIADSTAGVVWSFKYNSAEATYKWQFIGGPPLESEVDAQQSTSSVPYVDLTTAGPSVTVPRAGDYLCEVVCEWLNETVGAGTTMAPKFGSAATSRDDGWDIIANRASAWLTASMTKRKTGLSANDVIKCQYGVDSGTGYWRKRRLLVLPVRVS